jgi:hypothetical protein
MFIFSNYVCIIYSSIYNDKLKILLNYFIILFMDSCSGGMNGYISSCEREPRPPIFRSPVAGMEDIMDNNVM